MATEALYDLHARVTPAFGLPTASPGVVVCPQTAGWLMARLADAGELTLQVEADERTWRMRRMVGTTGSTLEKPLATPASASEVGTAIVRWASSVGLHARLFNEPHGVVRVNLARVRD